MNDCACHATPPQDRRGFLRRSFSIGVGILLGAVPLGAGLAVLFDPLKRKSAIGGPLRVTTLDALPDDGIPRKFSVLATRVDAWNRTAAAPIGAVYLRRTKESGVQALNVVCPHAGCFIDYVPAGKFLCPCHNSAFDLEGRIADPSSPSPRAMDALQVEVRNEKEVWVTFQNYEAGRAEKIPVS